MTQTFICMIQTIVWRGLYNLKGISHSRNMRIRIPLIICLLSVLVYTNFGCKHKDLQTSIYLEELFQNPPEQARPFVWWHWMGSNFSKEGITKDLEAMKESGIGGATIFNLASAVQESHFPTLNNPWPEQTYRSPAYWEAMKHAAKEADRLGLEIGLHNTVGYSTTGGPWIDEERSMQRLVWSDTTVTGGKQLSVMLKAPALIADEGWGKTGRTISFYKDVVVLAVPAGKSEISLTEVVNLTAEFDPLKGLIWNAPPGKWTIYRIGHASTGRPPHPVPDDLLGNVLEVDKMSVEQNIFHWDNVLNPVKEHLGEYIGKSFKHMLIDSYEAGNQNWTPAFRDEFIKQKGYDPIPWLAAFSLTVGTENDSKDRRIVESEEQTRRFDWDYRDVISQLFFESGWKTGKQKLAENSLQLQFEPYGGPFNTAQGVALSDLPMAEFWTAGIGGINPAVPAAARASGKTVVGAEAFTGRPEVSQFTEDPAFLKSSADKVFAQGINRMILHHWVHQPFDDKYQPGMGMGWWGTHFGRHQTWFEPGKVFFKYLARCQAMLQYGEQPADYLCVDKLEGFADLISTADFLHQNILVETGKLVLPSGRIYPFIVFSDSIMLPETANKIKELVAAGATVVSPKPVKSPSLKNYPECDSELKKIADEVWGNGVQNSFGKGFIFAKLDDAIAKAGITPDFIIEKASSPDNIKIAHRTSPEADIYFVANLSENRQNFAVSFRISGKQPELWQAEDGSINNAPVWEEKDGRTKVELYLKGTQSVFVVFRKTALKTDCPISVMVSNSTAKWNVHSDKNGNAVICSQQSLEAKVFYSTGKEKIINTNTNPIIKITGNWKVSFQPKLDKPFEMGFPELIDFSKHSYREVNYFAGTATYHKTINIESGLLEKGQKIILELGEMNDIAEVKVNGKNLGVLWYPPYSVDITDALKKGENKLEIAVTINWANRLIGDEQEPADFEWGKDRGEKMGRAILAYPDWFIKNEPRQSQGRKTFSIWYYYRKESPLKPAGLVGPVKLLVESVVLL